MKNSIVSTWAGILVAVILTAPAAHAGEIPRAYRIIALDGIWAGGIDKRGHVAGQQASGGAAIFDHGHGTTTALGMPAGAIAATAVGVNDHDLAVGYGEYAASVTRAVSWAAGVPTFLPTLPGFPAPIVHQATHVNGNGQISGTQTGGGKGSGFLVTNGVIAVVPPPPGSDSPTTVTAESINEAGHVVGVCIVSQSEHGYLYRKGASVDLGTFGGAGSTSQAHALNNHDDVVGVSMRTVGVGTAFLWRNGVMTDLGSLTPGLPSQALAINDDGLIVGVSYTSVFFENPIPFISNGTGMRDFRSLLDASGAGWDLLNPNAINKNGDIAGWGFFNGVPTAFKAKPLD